MAITAPIIAAKRAEQEGRLISCDGPVDAGTSAKVLPAATRFKPASRVTRDDLWRGYAMSHDGHRSSSLAASIRVNLATHAVLS